MKRLSLIVLFVLIVCGTARGEEAVADWPGVVSDLAEAFENGDAMRLERLFAPRVDIHSFQNDEPVGIEQLLKELGDIHRLACHAYFHPPAQMAADLAKDFQAAADVLPEAVVACMTPEDGARMQRANQTAAIWLFETLKPADGQPVGVIALWPTGDSAASQSAQSTPPKRNVIFVLFKAEEVSDGVLRITRLVYGKPIR